jgi:hypothetical protein
MQRMQQRQPRCRGYCKLRYIKSASIRFQPWGNNPENSFKLVNFAVRILNRQLPENIRDSENTRSSAGSMPRMRHQSFSMRGSVSSKSRVFRQVGWKFGRWLDLVFLEGLLGPES